MIKRFLAKHITYPMQDFVNGTSIEKTRQFLLESQYWSSSKMEDYQFMKFHKLLVHASQNVPYYRDLFKKEGIDPHSIKDFRDINKIPILTKDIARKENKNLIAEKGITGKIIKGVTGGTTGIPLKLLRDVTDQTFTWAAYYRWLSWMNIDIGDSMAKIWGAPIVLDMPLKTKLKLNIKNYYWNRSVYNSFNLNDNTIPDIINHLNKTKPKFIRGYLSALIQISKYIQESNKNFDFKPIAISSTTETLLPPFRKLIEETFNTTLYDQYGCGECNSMAYEHSNPKKMFIAAEHVYIEILNQNKQTNENGNIILTNLDNYAMPFIRYENGDMGSISKAPVDSKIKLPILNNITGRLADTIILKDGSRVHGVFFTDILHELFDESISNIHRFQVYQNITGEINFRVETEQKLNDVFEKKLYIAMQKYFNKVIITYHKALKKDSSGKFRYIISELT